MKKLPSSDSAMLVALILVILLSANALQGYVLTKQSNEVMKEMLQARMLDVANSAADMLDGDKLKTLTADDKMSPNYRYVNDILGIFRDNVALKYIYCVQAKGEKEFVFSVDPAFTDPGEFGSPVVYTDALYKASRGIAAADDEPYTDDWGTFYSAYSPVFDSSGKVAGIVAVDFDAHWVDAQIARQTHTIYLSMAISIVVCILLLFIATSRLRRRLRDMTKNIANLAHDLDDLTWEMSDMGENKELQKSMREKDTDLGSLNERIEAIRNGLRRYWDDANSRANSVISSLSSNYRSVYYRNLDSDRGICYKAVGGECDLAQGEEFPFTEKMEAYAKKYVTEEDRERFLQAMKPKEIRRGLMEKGLITNLFKISRDGVDSFIAVRIAAIKHPDNLVGKGLHAVGIGFISVESDLGEALQKNTVLQKDLNM